MIVRAITREDLQRTFERVLPMEGAEKTRLCERLRKEQCVVAAIVAYVVGSRGTAEHFRVVLATVMAVWECFQEVSTVPLAELPAGVITARCEQNVAMYRYFDAETDEQEFNRLARLSLARYPQRPVLEFAMSAVLGSGQFDPKAPSTHRMLMWVKSIVDAFCYTYPEPGWSPPRKSECNTSPEFQSV